MYAYTHFIYVYVCIYIFIYTYIYIKSEAIASHYSDVDHLCVHVCVHVHARRCIKKTEAGLTGRKHQHMCDSGTMDSISCLLNSLSR